MDKLDFKDADQPMPIPPEDKKLLSLSKPFITSGRRQ